MHRLFALFLALFLSPGVLAQTYAIDKGSYLLGGTVSYTSQSTDFGFDDDGERITQLVFNPSFAYFVTPGLALGADVMYTKSSFGGNAATSLGIGPQVAYFFGGPQTKAYPFIAAGLAYTDSGIGNGFSGFGGDLTGGLAYMIARNVGLSVEAFYQFSKLSGNGVGGQDIEIDSDTFGVRGGVTAFIF